MKRSIQSVCAAALLLLFSAWLCATARRTAVSAQTPASTPETLRLAGLRAPVTVARDGRGIPYIEAANDHDLMFAQGYVTASDRLWQMDLLRRTGRGELAEIFGSVALEEDKRRRTYGFARMSETSAGMLSDTALDALTAFAAGVNAFIQSRTEQTLPVEFRILQYRPRLWIAADSLVIGYLMAESLSSTWRTDVMRAALARLPKEQRDDLLIEFTESDTPVVGSDKAKAARQAGKSTAQVALPVSVEALRQAMWASAVEQQSLDRVGLGAQDWAASNNWVVSGKRTVTGKPLLANDPHLSPTVPSIWYLVNLSAPGVRVAGVSIPGINGVIIGHNERIAWGMTNLAPDVQDLYREKFDGTRYATPTGWKEAEVRRETINVRTAPTGTATEAVTLNVLVTRHGPVVLEKDGERYALQWTVLDPSRESVTTFLKLNRARNWKEFTEAISGFAGATQNFIYADVDGHIGYYGAGYIPIRKSGDGSVPYDGATDDGEWTGVIPFGKLPHVFDPPSGVIVTANARIVGRDYPYFLTHNWASPYRQKRINDLIAAKPKLTVEDFQAIQADNYAIGGATFARAVVKRFGDTASSAELSAKLKESLALLAAWDGRAAPDSRAALLVHEWRAAFARTVLTSAIGPELTRQYSWDNLHSLLDRIVTEWPARWLPKDTKTWEDVLVITEAEARASIENKLGADERKWTFGQAVQVRFAHPLVGARLVGTQFKLEPFPQSGYGHGPGIGPTPNVGPAVSMRLIADVSNWDNTRHGITVGQSGDPRSPHYQDQLNDWRKVTPGVFPFSKTAVTRAARQSLVLTP